MTNVLGDLRSASAFAVFPWHPCLSFTSQSKDGIELYRPPDRSGTPGKGHKDGNAENYREENGLNRNLRVENRVADLVSEQGSGGKSDDAADQRKKECLRKKYRGDREAAGAERFHQSDFNAALEDGGRHCRRNGQSRCEKRGERDQQHQSVDTREHSALALRDLPNLLGVRMRDNFF